MRVETESEVVRSPGREEMDRRQLFRRAAMLVGGVVAASALPTVALAANPGDPVLCANEAVVNTTVSVVWARNTGLGDGVWGEAVAGNKSGVVGIHWNSGGNGVYGRNNHTGGRGVMGDSANGVGVYGQTATGDGVVGTSGGASKSGVYGYHSAANGYGVFGRANTASARGVHGDSNSGVGVYGRTTNGKGVVAEATGSLGKALEVKGTSSFSKSATFSGLTKFSRSGVYTIAVGSQKPKITVPGGLTASSKFIVTAQGSPGSGVYVKYAKYYDNTRFRIVLNKKATKSCKVAWMVID